MGRLFSAVGAFLFAASLVYFGYSLGWRFGTDETSTASRAWPAIASDVLLFTAFALHHSLFARLGLKRWVERTAPPELERSIYVWISSALLIVVCAAWRPVPGVLWHVSGYVAVLLRAGLFAGVVLTIISARRLGVGALAGLNRAPIKHSDDNEDVAVVIHDTGPYGLVRHPIYLGWFLMVWCLPLMNGTRLTFAIISCGYLIAAIPFEERDLRRTLGPAYSRYAQRVKWRVIPGLY